MARVSCRKSWGFWTDRFDKSPRPRKSSKVCEERYIMVPSTRKWTSNPHPDTCLEWKEPQPGSGSCSVHFNPKSSFQFSFTNSSRNLVLKNTERSTMSGNIPLSMLLALQVASMTTLEVTPTTLIGRSILRTMFGGSVWLCTNYWRIKMRKPSLIT